MLEGSLDGNKGKFSEDINEGGAVIWFVGKIDGFPKEWIDGLNDDWIDGLYVELVMDELHPRKR